MVSSDPAMRVLASSVVSPRLIYTTFFERITTRLYRCFGFKIQELPDDQVLVRNHLLDGYRPSIEFFIATLGLLRNYALLIGDEPAVVEASISPTGGDYLVTLPRSRTLASRADQALRSLVPRATPASLEQQTMAAIRDALSIAQQECSFRQPVDELGRALVACADHTQLFDQLVSFLRQYFFCDYVRLWARPPCGSDFSLLHTHGRWTEAQGPVHTRELMVEDDPVGRLQLDLRPPTDDGVAACVEALFSWVSLGLRNCLVAENRQRPNAAQASVRSTRRQRRRELSESSGLTPRQAEVLALLVQGLSNKEIAQKLGCSVKTVEIHVTQVLRKTGAGSRSALAALYWQDRHRPSSPP